MTVACKKVLEYLKQRYDDVVTKQEIIADTGLSMAQVTAAIRTLNNKSLLENIESNSVEQNKNNANRLTINGLAYDPEKEEKEE